MSFTVMIRNWFLMIDIGLLFSEMRRRSAAISYQKLDSNHGTILIYRTLREITRVSFSGNTTHHYDTPGAAISLEVTKIRVPFFGPHYWDTSYRTYCQKSVISYLS